MTYLFGDTDIAAKRLKILADVYAESTKTFLLDTVIERPRLAIDLGCGPGYTTHLLADILQCDYAAGIDNSEHFISLAHRTETQKISFYHHNVTSVPFPVGPGDFLYCRFLLTHVQNPLTVVARWGTQLQPRGLLLMEETEWIHTKNPTFKLYLNIVETMLEHQSRKLYVGPLLDSIKDTDILERRISQIRSFPVSTPQAAIMFFLNIQSWRQQPFIQENFSSSTIDQLEHDLKVLTANSNIDMEIEWGLRQLAFERV